VPPKTTSPHVEVLPCSRLAHCPTLHHTTPSLSLCNGTRQTKHRSSSLNHFLEHSSCAECPHSGRITALSSFLYCARQIGHLVTRTPRRDSFSLTLPCAVVLRESTLISPGRRVAIASGLAAGDFAGPRKRAICEKPCYRSVSDEFDPLVTPAPKSGGSTTHLVLPPRPFQAGDQDVQIGIFDRNPDRTPRRPQISHRGRSDWRPGRPSLPGRRGVVRMRPLAHWPL
jgi:hypothetical protein